LPHLMGPDRLGLPLEQTGLMEDGAFTNRFF